MNWTGHNTTRSAATASALDVRRSPSLIPPSPGNRRFPARPPRIRRLPQNWELDDAREVQQQLLPQCGPAVAGLDYAGRCRPAASVGGDYYDFLPISDGRLGFAIGDVSGKGIPAALLMATLQASLRGLAISSPPALPLLMASLNRLMCDATPSNRFATVFYGDRKSTRLN